jgi:DNA-binding CsgD family transcriptional regulator
MSLHCEDRTVAQLDRTHQEPPDAALTTRQLECLSWTGEGKSASDIGQILGISGRTVEGHLAKVCQHLGVRTRIQAVVKAKDLGFLGRRKT